MPDPAAAARAPDATDPTASAARASSGVVARLGLGCLMALVLLLPLMPVEGRFASLKHVALLGIGTLGLVLVGIDALRGRALPALGTPTDLAVALFLAAAVPSVALAENPGMARYSAGLLAALGIVYVLTIKTVRTPLHVQRLYLAVFLVAVVVALAGLDGYRRFLLQGAPEPDRRDYLSTFAFAHSYLAAQYLVMVFAGGAVVLTRARLRRSWQVALAAGLLVMGAFLVVVGSRGAYAAVAVALATSVALYLRTRTGRHRYLSTALKGLALLAGILLVVALMTWLGRDATDGDGGSESALGLAAAFQPATRPVEDSRLQIWRDTVHMAADNLVTGVGLGGFDTALPRYHFTSEPVPHAHNQFLDVLAETGLVGLLAFLLLVNSAIRAIRKGAPTLAHDDVRRPLFFAAVAALVAALVYFLFETPLEWVEAGSLIMILLAVVSRAGCVSRESPTPGAATVCALGGMIALAAFVLPTWRDYARATELAADHASRLGAALTARSEGNEAEAQARLHALVERLARADELFPYRADFARLQADALVKFERYDEALQAYRLADQRVPDSFENLNAIGQLLLLLDRPAEAIEPLRQAIISHRGLRSAETYALLGRAYSGAGRHEEAWVVYDDLINRHYYHRLQPRLLKEAAYSLAALDRYLPVADAMLTEYRRLAPGDPDARNPELAELESYIRGRLAQPRPLRLPEAMRHRLPP